MSARQWVDFLLPGALTLHFDWIRDLVRGDHNLVARISRSPTAQRLLTRQVYRWHEIVVPDRASLEPRQQWLLWRHDRQRELARALGIEALREIIRTTVDAHLVTAIRQQLGEETYRRALAGPALNVEGLERTQFVQSVQQGRLAEHIAGVGAALLETTAPGAPFCRMRMRFVFSPTCWHSRPRNVRVDESELSAHLKFVTEA